MERVCREGDGLFPAPSEIKMSCTCPDWAGMCKHVAAALYGAGARLDAVPGLLFALRGVDCAELIKGVGADLPDQSNKAGAGHSKKGPKSFRHGWVCENGVAQFGVWEAGQHSLCTAATTSLASATSSSNPEK
jgi:uncharacterized Zn finger protein